MPADDTWSDVVDWAKRLTATRYGCRLPPSFAFRAWYMLQRQRKLEAQEGLAPIIIHPELYEKLRKDLEQCNTSTK